MSKSNRFAGKTVQQWFSIVLWLIMLHSLAVGLGLILAPSALLSFFDFSFHPARFFVTQGGVFHIVMAICYGMAANDIDRGTQLITLTVLAKSIATVFLVIYYLAVDPVLVILLSGIGDFLMAVTVFFLNRKTRQAQV